MPDERTRTSKERGIGSRVIYKLKRFARYIGLYRRTITMPDGVRYRERSGISIRRALSEHGPGLKKYDVRFPWIDSEGRRSMRIRYTASRLYGDVGHDPRTVLYGQFIESITPGQRVLEIGCGTGSGSARLIEAVGPSGGVVAIDRDGQSIRFARQRHRSDHASFELDWIQSLTGETDGAFHAIIAVDPIEGAQAPPDRSKAASDIARVLHPGGMLVLVAHSLEQLAPILEEFLTCGISIETAKTLQPCQRSGWCGAVLKRAGELNPPKINDGVSPGSFQS